ncbi:MAG: low molecular weight phosphotyrosine protein phosphatase [Cytophagales bacterium]|nr:MAG: low molecular weight phosphotyrosine protein phosphatase [Cytophagales bacterium]
MIKILFVCLGNICRSPLAEGIFNKLLNEKELQLKISSDSAGTGNYHIGDKPDKRSIKVAKQNGIELTHKGRQIGLADFQNFDYILAMDNDNFKNIKALEKKARDLDQTIKAKIYLTREFDNLYDDEVDDSENETAWDVADPYHGTEEDFQECYDTLERCCTEFLKYLIKAHKL